MLQEVNDYRVLDVIGEGSYGKVYKVLDSSGNIFAMKSLKFNHQYVKNIEHAKREIEMLKKLKHPNIVDLIDFIEKDTHLYIIMNYMDTDMKKYLRGTTSQLRMAFLKSVTRQIFSGLKCIHDNRILHRDITSSNILLDQSGNVRIADFSLSRFFNSNDRGLYTQGVVSLGYRPPEILLGQSRYSSSIDVWSVGVLLVEVCTGSCPFKGENELSQLFEIFKIVGTPSNQYLKTYCGSFPDLTVTSYNSTLTEYLLFNSNVVFEDESSDFGYFIDLVSKCLAFDPSKRVTVDEALKHEFLI